MTTKERCPRCGRRVRSLKIDDTDERVMVSGRAVMAAFQIPGLEGCVTDYVNLVHVCARRKP